MSSSGIRSILTTLRGHSVEGTESVIFYPADVTWDRYGSTCFDAQSETASRSMSSSSYSKKTDDMPRKREIPMASLPPPKLPQHLDSSTHRVVRVVVISDTHEYHEKLSIPAGDLLLHCGDILQADRFTLFDSNSRHRFKGFLRWLGRQPCRHKVIIGGNHDLLLSKLSASEVRSLVAKEGAGAVYLEDEVLVMRKDLTLLMGDAEQRDCCAGLTIFGTPMSYPNTRRSPNEAFQSTMRWHHSAYGLSHRQLEAYRPLPVVLRRLRDPIIVVLNNGSRFFLQTVARCGGDDGKDATGKKEKKKGSDDHKGEEDVPSASPSPSLLNFKCPSHRYTVVRLDADGNIVDVAPAARPGELINAADKDNAAQTITQTPTPSPPPTTTVKHHLINAPHPMVAHIRLAMLEEAKRRMRDDATVVGSSNMSSNSNSSDSPSGGGGATLPRQQTRNSCSTPAAASPAASSVGGGEEKKASGGGFLASIRTACVGPAVSEAHESAHSYCQRYNSVSRDGMPVSSAACGEVFSVEGYQSMRRRARGQSLQQQPPMSPTFTATSASQEEEEGDDVPVLPPVEPLSGIDIAMTHQSRSHLLVDYVQRYLRPRLMHAGGHVHEAKGIHTEYRCYGGGDDEEETSHHDPNTLSNHHHHYHHANNNRAATNRRWRVPSVGGAMTQGSFGKEWIQPATVIDFVVPW